MNFGQTIQKRRIEKNISLRRMAELIDVSPSYLSRIETGKVPAPAEAVIKSLAYQLDLHPDALLAEAGKVSEDLLQIIRSNPIDTAELIRKSASGSAGIILALPQTTSGDEGENSQ